MQEELGCCVGTAANSTLTITSDKRADDCQFSLPEWDQKTATEEKETSATCGGAEGVSNPSQPVPEREEDVFSLLSLETADSQGYQTDGVAP